MEEQLIGHYKILRKYFEQRFIEVSR